MFNIERHKIKKILLLSVCILLVYSCGNSGPGKCELFDSFVGTWKLEDDSQYERWEKNDDGSYLSTGFNVKGNDTIISEKVKIYSNGSGWYFETQVSGQNDGKAVVFKSVILNDSIVQFENMQHDFPNMINYYLMYQNSMRAFIAGKSDTIYFNYSRVRL